MPILIKKPDWHQTENTVYLSIPLNGISQGAFTLVTQFFEQSFFRCGCECLHICSSVLKLYLFAVCPCVNDSFKANIDVFHAADFFKVNFGPYICEVFWYEEVENESLRSKIWEGRFLIEVKKVMCKKWASLQKDLR